MTQRPAKQEVVLITGMSGSGKSVALRALEDAGYFCVDNLPPELIESLVALPRAVPERKIGIAVDVRSAESLPQLPMQLHHLRVQGIEVQSIFLDATTDTLVRRFSETRRRHPLSAQQDAVMQYVLVETIDHERELLADLREQAHVIDTSVMRASQLQSYVKAMVAVPVNQLTLVFESFAFKRGIPMDADYVFDVRMLPNPHYDLDLRPLNGRDKPVQRFVDEQPDAVLMLRHIENFLEAWLPKLASDHRNYVTVAIGCTGGQHRSVYLVEKLTELFIEDWVTLKRHRELDAHGKLTS